MHIFDTIGNSARDTRTTCAVLFPRSFRSVDSIKPFYTLQRKRSTLET